MTKSLLTTSNALQIFVFVCLYAGGCESKADNLLNNKNE